MLSTRTLWLLLGSAFFVACTITTGPPPSQQPAPSPAAPAAPATTAAVTEPTPAAPPAASASYDPCAGKKCGERCNLCPQATPGCFETALVKMCHPDGQCKPATTVDCNAKPAGG
jgi:hypothetical protein